MLSLKIPVLVVSVAFALLLLASCDFFEDDFEDPTPFLQYNATAEITDSIPEALQVQVQVNNQHRTSDVVLVHSVCNVSVLLTATDHSISPIQPIKACTPANISSTIQASTTKTFTFDMPVQEILDQGAPAGEYDVAATIRFAQIEQQVLPAGRILLPAE